FSGTSSATPIVTGVLAGVQGFLKARGRRPLTSREAIVLLRGNGSPQQDSDPAEGRPASQRIGNRPDMRTLLPASAKFRCRSADFDGDGKAEVLVASARGIA